DGGLKLQTRRHVHRHFLQKFRGARTVRSRSGRCAAFPLPGFPVHSTLSGSLHQPSTASRIKKRGSRMGEGVAGKIQEPVPPLAEGVLCRTFPTFYRNPPRKGSNRRAMSEVPESTVGGAGGSERR